MKAPSDGVTVTLLIKTGETSDSPVTQIEDAGGVVQEKLPLDYLKVEISETDLGALETVSSIERIEIESSGGVMDSDFRTPPGSVR